MCLIKCLIKLMIFLFQSKPNKTTIKMNNSLSTHTLSTSYPDGIIITAYNYSINPHFQSYVLLLKLMKEIIYHKHPHANKHLSNRKHNSIISNICQIVIKYLMHTNSPSNRFNFFYLFFFTFNISSNTCSMSFFTRWQIIR